MSEQLQVKPFTREKRLRTRSVNGTLALGEMVTEILLSTAKSTGAGTTTGRLIILRGDLGAGKTTLVKGIATALGAAAAEDVTSPTFTLVHEYQGRKIRLYHLDVYRLETERELATLGIDEMASESDALVIVEWGERFPSLAARADAVIAMGVGENETERLLLLNWRE